MKPDIGKDYAALCSTHGPFTELLFGDDLQKQLKDIGDENKIGAQIQGKGGQQSNTSTYGNNRGSFKASKNFRGQHYEPWKRREQRNQSSNNNHNNKRQ